MPTLTELQRSSPLRTSHTEEQDHGEELIVDSRASLSPSQLVDRKLQARAMHDFGRQSTDTFRPRAK